jgi:exo-1,4-beta-D-glucosaminidase
VIDVPADSSMRVSTLQEPSTTAPYLLDLRLTDATGRALSTNFYWLANRMDALSDSSTWYMTPVKNYADFTALRSMPQSAVNVRANSSSSGGTGTTRVTLTNPTRAIAFFLRLQVTGRDGEEVLPVEWEDNYVSLLPGETRTVTASYSTKDLHGAKPSVLITGWNVHRVFAK